MVLRDSPVQWNDVQRPPLPDGSKPAGAFGTTIFYHSLTTMDYAGRALILRARPNPDSRGRGSMTGSRCGSPGITTHARWAALDGLRRRCPAFTCPADVHRADQRRDAGVRFLGVGKLKQRWVVE